MKSKVSIRPSLRNISRILALSCQTVRHRRDLKRLVDIPDPRLIRRFLDDRPEIRWRVLTPLISAQWNASRRLEVIRDHFIIVGSLGGVLTVGPDEFLELANLSGIAPGLHVAIDAPQWFLGEGCLAVSLWLRERRIYTISFCLGYEEGRIVVFVGGLQGVQDDEARPLYRALTKAAAGMRPRDLLFEIFRMLCRNWQATCILGISDSHRHHFSAYSRRWIGIDPVHTSYDEAWSDRGGELRDDGFFVLSVTAPVRPAQQIAPKKRAMYRSRYAMLDHICAGIDEVVLLPPTFRRHPNLGDLTRPETTGLPPAGEMPASCPGAFSTPTACPWPRTDTLHS